MTKPKRKSNSTRKTVRTATQAVSKFVPSPDIIRRSVTVEEAETAFLKRCAMWSHGARQ